MPPQFICADSGAPAAYICTECRWDSGSPFYCERCARGHGDMLLLVTNSPRMGARGCAGELDIFAFVRPQEALVSASSQAPIHKEPRKRLQFEALELYPEELYDPAFAFRNAKLWAKLYESYTANSNFDNVFTETPDSEIEQLINQMFRQKILIELYNTHDLGLALLKTLQDEYADYILKLKTTFWTACFTTTPYSQLM